MKVYTWNIPEIYCFPIYDRHIPGIFHIYDTIQIPDESGGWVASDVRRPEQRGFASDIDEGLFKLLLRDE